MGLSGVLRTAEITGVSPDNDFSGLLSPAFTSRLLIFFNSSV
jgi:hypothetical protein